MAGKNIKKQLGKKGLRINLSEHSLDINIRKCDYAKFSFKEIEDYVRALAGTREYQYEAIRQIMIYLWGGGYKNIAELAKENYESDHKIQLKNRYVSTEDLIYHLPLADRLSGVVHMATGTGKSFVLFAIAHLSIVMGYTKRVLVLGPSSTIIEQGLTDKFKNLINSKDIINKLPQKYQNIPVDIINSNQVAGDNSIMIENINAVFSKDRNAIGDTLFKDTNEVLVLGDEIHHAYTHLKFSENKLILDTEEGREGKGDGRDERLWMRFLRKEPKIKRHIGFTGTPYNQNEYFSDVIYNYSIKDATEDKFIKKINPIIRTERDEEGELTKDQRYEFILKKHLENEEKYSYKINNKARVKPITIFICASQQSASSKAEEFINFLGEYNNRNTRRQLVLSEFVNEAREKVICVTSDSTTKEVQDQLDNVEKLRNKVEFIFAVNKLSEGWDVENVFQIVPMEEKAFNSKLLISQVLGRGLRLPERAGVPATHILGNYPEVTITNHEKFADHITELLDDVIQCDIYFESNTFKKEEIEGSRSNLNFKLFNMNYLGSPVIKDAPKENTQMAPKNLSLTPFKETTDLHVVFKNNDGKYQLSRSLLTIDQVVSEISSRFKLHSFEKAHFDFGDLVVEGRVPNEQEVEKIIRDAMKKAKIKIDMLSDINRKQITLYFNQYLPRSKKKREFENIEGDLNTITTKKLQQMSVRSSELEKEVAVFISEDFENELSKHNQFVLDYIKKTREKIKPAGQMSMDQMSLDEFVRDNSEVIRVYAGESKPPFVVNKSKLKTPQDIVIVSHAPERLFVYNLIKSSDFIDSWIKSPDMSFYSIDYEYWKSGKDRTRRSFNPDFFVKINLEKYIEKVKANVNRDDLKKLEELQDNGIHTIIKVVEIKSDDDDDETTPKKAEYAREHFQKLNNRLNDTNMADVDKEFQKDIRQHYTFDLLTPRVYFLWFDELEKGVIL